jgi:hypothetical protein
MVSLIPQPRELRVAADPVPAHRLAPRPLPQGLDTYADAVAELVGPAVDRGPGLPVRWARQDGPPEAYELSVSTEEVRVGATDALGALHAARTLADLLDGSSPGSLHRVQIRDAPTLPTRGVFVESFSGPDRMTLAEWKALVRRLARLKLNTLAVSLYGCWDLRHDGDRSEFLFVPLRNYPELRTPHRIVTWDPGTASETTVDYLPRMFAEDFFASVAGYARSQGMEIIPLLGGPGHSTLIPRLVPEVSAVGEDGTPSGYGYCVTRASAVAALGELVTVLVEQHLRPAGVRRLLVPGDEFYPIRNVDPDDRRRLVSPYCRCPDCRELSPGELLQRYFVVVGRVLARFGIAMVHWQDTLVREGVLDAYADRVQREGLPAPVVAWWRYSEPTPEVRASPTETWVTPTTGLFASLFHQDFAGNIEAMLRAGARAGAAGALAYDVPAPGNHRNYACLADLAWNLPGSGGATGFKRRWADLVAPDDPDRARQAYAVGDSIVGCYPLMTYVVDHLLPYFATAAAGATRYPDDLLRSFSVLQPALLAVLVQARDTLRESARLMPQTRAPAGWPDPGASWRHEVRRTAAHVDLFLRFVETTRSLDELAGERLDRAIEDLEAAGRDLLDAVAAGTPGYLAPIVLREHWGLVRAIRPTLERLVADPPARPHPAGTWHSWLV